MTSETLFALLGSEDPDPVERLNGKAGSDLLLVCEHAGRAIPTQLQGLAPSEAEMQRHIAWDIGAAALTRSLSARLEAPAVLQRYSRLVIDCNRPPGVPSSMPKVSDGTEIPFNQEILETERVARITEIFRPFEAAITTAIDARPPKLLADIHSYTPVMQGFNRPWEVGLLFNRDDSGAHAVMHELLNRRPGLVAAFNEPYRVTDLSDYTIPTHGEKRGLRHVLIEIRNDQIDTPEGVEDWSSLLAACFQAILEN
ncbi:MAG: N-formylglutamate amidohydrolase [Kiloniellales bacterium]